MQIQSFQGIGSARIQPYPAALVYVPYASTNTPSPHNHHATSKMLGSHLLPMTLGHPQPHTALRPPIFSYPRFSTRDGRLSIIGQRAHTLTVRGFLAERRTTLTTAQHSIRFDYSSTVASTLSTTWSLLRQPMLGFVDLQSRIRSFRPGQHRAAHLIHEALSSPLPWSRTGILRAWGR